VADEQIKLMSTGEAARVLGISARTLAGWAQQGIVTPAFTTAGGHYRFDLDDLRRQIRELRERQSDGE
jgi:excisionase family DNA binding protein